MLPTLPRSSRWARFPPANARRPRAPCRIRCNSRQRPFLSSLCAHTSSGYLGGSSRWAHDVLVAHDEVGCGDQVSWCRIQGAMRAVVGAGCLAVFETPDALRFRSIRIEPATQLVACFDRGTTLLGDAPRFREQGLCPHLYVCHVAGDIAPLTSGHEVGDLIQLTVERPVH